MDEISTPPSITALTDAVEDFLKWRQHNQVETPLIDALATWKRELTISFYADRLAQVEHILSDQFTLADPSLTVEQLTYRIRNVLAGNALEIIA